MEKCKLAFIGTGRLDVCSEDSVKSLKFGTYNSGRTLQDDLYQAMVGMMKIGDCTSADNPLILAVEPGHINLDTLNEQGNVVGKLKDIEFLDRPPLELLAGMHRVHAARAVSKYLRTLLRKLENSTPGRRPLERAGDGSDEDGPTDEVTQATKAFEAEINWVKSTLALVEVWPVHVYDIGGFYFHRTWCHKIDTHGRPR